MKILFVYDGVYPESLGGLEYRNHCLAHALAARGHEVTLAGWIAGEGATKGGVTIRPMALRGAVHDGEGKRSMLVSLRFAVAAAAIDVGAYDVIETANIPYAHLFPLAVRCAVSRRPLVVTWYEYFGVYWSSYASVVAATTYRIVERLCAQLGRVNAVSGLTAGRLRHARLGRGSAEIPVIACGVWLQQIAQAALAPLSDAPVLMFAGRLIAEKRVDLLLEAVAKMNWPARFAGRYHLGIAGNGPDRPRLEALAIQLGIAPRVKFYGRFPDISDMWRVLAGACIAVQPSVREGFGLFPLEALALGRPVVICEAPDSAVGALVRDDIEGLCMAADSDALAAGLQDLLADTPRWRRMSEAASARASAYDWPEIAARFEAFVEGSARASHQHPMRRGEVPPV